MNPGGTQTQGMVGNNISWSKCSAGVRYTKPHWNLTQRQKASGRCFLTFTLFSILFGLKRRFPLLQPLVNFGESKFVFCLATISTLPRSALLLCAVVRFKGLFTTWLPTKFGPYGIWTEQEMPLTNLVDSDGVHGCLM